MEGRYHTQRNMFFELWLNPFPHASGVADRTSAGSELSWHGPSAMVASISELRYPERTQDIYTTPKPRAQNYAQERLTLQIVIEKTLSGPSI